MLLRIWLDMARWFEKRKMSAFHSYFGAVWPNRLYSREVYVAALQADLPLWCRSQRTAYEYTAQRKSELSRTNVLVACPRAHVRSSATLDALRHLVAPHGRPAASVRKGSREGVGQSGSQGAA
jgi:hypothetical protein